MCLAIAWSVVCIHVHPPLQSAEVQQQSELAQRRLVEAAQRGVEEVQEIFVGGNGFCKEMKGQSYSKTKNLLLINN